MSQRIKLIERDKILEHMLDNISKDEVLTSKLILRGGGALHFAYGSPRYSNDLDFITPNMSEDSEEIIYHLENLGIYDEDSIMESYLKKEGNRFIRTNHSIDHINANIEIFELENLEPEYTQGKYFPMLIETPEQIYADKIYATLSRMIHRDSIKPTDLFDLDYLYHFFRPECPIQILELKEIEHDEMGILDDENIYNVIEYISDENNHESFRKDISYSLLPDVYNNMKLDSNYFKQSTKYFEDYLDEALEL